MRSFARFALVLLAGLLATCSSATKAELVVGLATDLVGPQAADPLARAQITVWMPYYSDDIQFQRKWTVPGTLPPLPGSLSFTIPSDKTKDGVRIELAGETKSGAYISRSAIVTDLSAGESRFLRLMLLASCLGKSCTGTCIEGNCRTLYIDKDRLAEYVQPPPGLESRMECPSVDANGRPTQPVRTDTLAAVPVSPDSCAEKAQCIEGTCYKNVVACNNTCGREGCDACGNGYPCKDHYQCRSLNCVGRCAPRECNNGKLDEGETDIDCGGPCRPCLPAQRCHTDFDCGPDAGGRPDAGVYLVPCFSGRCSQPTCSDGVQDGDETGVDSGGSCVPPLPPPPPPPDAEAHD